MKSGGLLNLAVMYDSLYHTVNTLVSTPCTSIVLLVTELHVEVIRYQYCVVWRTKIISAKKLFVLWRYSSIWPHVGVIWLESRTAVEFPLSGEGQVEFTWKKSGLESGSSCFVAQCPVLVEFICSEICELPDLHRALYVVHKGNTPATKRHSLSTGVDTLIQKLLNNRFLSMHCKKYSMLSLC